MTHTDEQLEAMVEAYTKYQSPADRGLSQQMEGMRLALIAGGFSSQSEVEPVAWLNPSNGVVINNKKKTQVGLEGNADGYANFSVPLFTTPPTEPAIRELALREVKELVRKLHSGSSHPDAESWIADELDALIPQTSALEELCMRVAELTAKHVQVYGSYDVDLQEIVTKVIAEWEGKR